MIIILPAQGCPTDYRLRLTGSASFSVMTSPDEVLGVNYGRMEICQNGVWQIFCGNYLDPADLQVICRQLGIDPVGKH